MVQAKTSRQRIIKGYIFQISSHIKVILTSFLYQTSGFTLINRTSKVSSKRTPLHRDFASGFTLTSGACMLPTQTLAFVGKFQKTEKSNHRHGSTLLSGACKLPIFRLSKNTKLQKSTTYNCSNGFTLIEVLVATALTLIVMGFVIGLQYMLANARRVTIDNYYSVDTTNVTINTITREIRTARLSEMGTYPIESASSNQIIFYSDIDFDDRIERIRYTLTGSTLVKGVIEPTGAPVSYPSNTESVKTLSTEIETSSSPLFTYYNGDWPLDTINNPLSSPPSLSDIKLIRISLEVATDNEPYTLESFTALRMLKENL